MRGFRKRLTEEFEKRRQKNPRYSLRAFASFLGADHSTLSQILRGARPLPEASIRRWAEKLGLDREEALAYAAAERVPDPERHRQEERLRHWTAEAMAIASEPVHWRLLRLCRVPDFRADSRWIAGELGVSADEVNLALSRLLRLRLIETGGGAVWKDLTGLTEVEESSFRKIALARARRFEMSPENR
jgi:transcriptional regulator with XRE-family HTH domain